MKAFILILAMLATPLAAQSTSTQISQTKVPSAAQQPQTVVKSTAKPAQSPIVFAAKQLNEYGNEILDRSETFYNNRMTHLLWTMGIVMATGLAIIGILIPIILELYRKRSFEKKLATQAKKFEERLSQADATLEKSTEEQIQKLENKLINQIDDREDKQTKAVGSNLSWVFTALGGFFLTLKEWDTVIRTYFIAIQHSIDGQCTSECIKTSHIKDILENKHVTNSLNLGNLEYYDDKLEEIKARLETIADTEQRVQVESKIKDLQMIVHALIIKKRQDGKTTTPQTEPQKDK